MSDKTDAALHLTGQSLPTEHSGHAKDMPGWCEPWQRPVSAMPFFTALPRQSWSLTLWRNLRLAGPCWGLCLLYISMSVTNPFGGIAGNSWYTKIADMCALSGLGWICLFGLAVQIELAYLGRILIGIGCSVGFLGSLALAGDGFLLVSSGFWQVCPCL